MQDLAVELERLINKHFSALHSLPEDILTARPSPQKWSKKEIIGHMIDSAQNNARRFIVAQYEETPHIVYNQDKWVALSGYQHYDSNDLVNFWLLTNRHICSLLRNINKEMESRECKTEATHSIKWLAADYIKHLKHHLHQVLDLEPAAYP
jgi:hypothetical protein